MNEDSRRASFAAPDANNLSVKRTIAWVNSYEEQLWDHLERVPQLARPVGHAILAGFLVLACQCSNVANIEIGRYGIAALPQDWVLANIEDVAEPMLESEDPWEYWRLLEVYAFLDDELTRTLAARAAASNDPDIREAGQEFLYYEAESNAA